VLDAPGRADMRGLFHMGGGGEGTWADFAAEICGWLHATRGRRVQIERITTADYPTPARRPLNSRLSSQRLAAIHGFSMPDWRTSVSPILERLA
jgi:dTDP-4-dehydrorhamnose reductase